MAGDPAVLALLLWSRPIDKLSPCLINEGKRAVNTVSFYMTRGQVLDLGPWPPETVNIKTYRVAFPGPAFLSISKGAYLRISLVRLRLCLRPDPLGPVQ